MSCRCVLTNVPGGYPLSNVDIELVRTDTMAIVQVVQTNKAGEAQFTTTMPAPCFFRPRIIGKNWNLQVTDPGLGYSLYDRVVAQDGLGTDLTFTSAVAALAATGGTIGARTGDYHEGAILTIPTNKYYVIEGIGHGILEDVNFTPQMGVQIHNPGGAGGFNGVIFHVDSGARLTLRGVEVHQDRAYDAIEAHTAPYIIIEDSWVHVDNAVGSAVDTSYDLRIHRSVIEAASNDAIDVGTTIVYLEVTESRLTSTTYSINGSFAEAYFEKCQMSKFRCHTTTIASKLRIENCKVAGGTAGSPGIEVGNGGHDDIQIFDNEIDGGTGHAIQIGYTTLDSAERYQVNNNRMKSTAGHGLYIAGYVKGLTACGNMFSGNAAGYCIETANALYPEYAVFGCNTHDGSALGVYGNQLITAPGASWGDHGLLSGLGSVVLWDDDHPQYVLHSLFPINTIPMGSTGPGGFGRLIAQNMLDESVFGKMTGFNPACITLAEQTVIGRLTGGHVDDIAIGIVNDNIVQIDQPIEDPAHPIVAGDYARFTANGLQGRSVAEMLVDLGVDVTLFLKKDGTTPLTGQWNPGAFVIGNYDFTAKPGTLYVGDVNFELYLEAGGPVMIVDSGLDFMGYVRASNTFTFAIGGVSYLQLETTGLLVDHILELAAGHGVEVDGCLIKDGRAALALGLRTTTGPTDLIVGAVVDGEYLMRVGATIVSGAPGGGGGDDVLALAYAAAL